MTKSGLIRAVTKRAGHASARDIEVIVNTLLDAMTEALAAGARIEIRGFGSFTVRRRRPRQGRNPKTGEAIGVPGKRVPFFTVGQALRMALNDAWADTVAPTTLRRRRAASGPHEDGMPLPQ